MALPTLDAVFASAADQPRRYMLSQWLVNELGSGLVANYVTLPERYLWAKIAVAAGAPKDEAFYINAPKQHAWSDIYNAVSGDIAESTVVVSGLSDSSLNGKYMYDQELNSKPLYKLTNLIFIFWDGASWVLENNGDYLKSDSDVQYPWLATNWYADPIDPTGLILTPETPNHTDWSEKQALGHIAAAYRGDTANPANLATYIDWPWRYQVASIIGQLEAPSGPTFPSDGLLAFWKLDNLTDASGNGNSLTNNNNVQFVSGKIGNAAEFDGTNYFNTTTQIGQSFSLSFWLYPTEVSGYKNVLTWRVSGTGSIGYDGSVYWYNDSGGFLVQSSAGIITTNQWHHVVLVCDNNDITIYLDNSSVATGTDNNTRLATNLVIGAYLNGTETIVGKLDAVGIWDRAITNEERSILYNNGEGVEL